MDPLLLAIDIGTSSCRAALFNETGTRILESTSQRTYGLITSTDGGAELDPAVLLKSIRECLAQTLGFFREKSELKERPIAGIGVSCFWHSLIGTDETGTPLTRIITWADARCAPDAKSLRADFREEDVHARTGCMVRSSFWPAKLRWLKRTQEHVFLSVQKWMSPAEWIQLQLAGSATTAVAMATGTGFFNPSLLEWDETLLRHCLLRHEQLLPVTDEPVLTEGTLAQDFRELSGVPWFPAIGDGAASNLGSGCTSPGLAAINVGTSAALRIMCSGIDAKAPTGLFCYRVDQSRYLVGGAISNAGNLRAWGLKALQTGRPEDLEAALASRPTPNHGLTVLPFWSAERAPTWNEEMRGTIVGITQATTGLDLFQAITEATYQRIAQIADLLMAHIRETPKFFVSGGIQHSKTALQRLADILNHPLYANPEAEASIRGAAVFAMEKLGIRVEPLAQTEPILPNLEAAKLYREARSKQTRLEALLRSESL